MYNFITYTRVQQKSNIVVQRSANPKLFYVQDGFSAHKITLCQSTVGKIILLLSISKVYLFSFYNNNYIFTYMILYQLYFQNYNTKMCTDLRLFHNQLCNNVVAVSTKSVDKQIHKKMYPLYNYVFIDRKLPFFNPNEIRTYFDLASIVPSRLHGREFDNPLVPVSRIHIL